VYNAKALQSRYRSGKESENKWVFSLDLKDDSDEGCDDEVTSGGRLFHVFAAAMERARSPMVRRQVGGTTSAVVDDERIGVAYSSPLDQ